MRQRPSGAAAGLEACLRFGLGLARLPRPSGFALVDADVAAGMGSWPLAVNIENEVGASESPTANIAHASNEASSRERVAVVLLRAYQALPS